MTTRHATQVEPQPISWWRCASVHHGLDVTRMNVEDLAPAIVDEVELAAPRPKDEEARPR